MSRQVKLPGFEDLDVDFRSPRVLSHTRNIPEGWTLAEINSVCDVKTGHTPSREVDEYWGGDIPWIAIHDLSDNDSMEIQSTEEQITQEGLDNSGAKLLPKGTLVICRTGSIGESAILGRPMATDQSTVSFECHQEIMNPYYLKYLFAYHQSDLERLAIGSTHPSIQLHFFPDLYIPIPPSEEQRKIASVLYNIGAC
jgi:type I restriction enzyme S subunit